MDMLTIDSSRRPTVMELLNYPVIEVSKGKSAVFGRCSLIAVGAKSNEEGGVCSLQRRCERLRHC